MTVDLSDPQIQKITYQCLMRIQSVYDSLKSAERRAVDFLMTDPEFLAKNSIVEVAVRAGCSEATLVRLSYRMGFGSYSDLKAAVLKEDATENLECLYEGIEEHDDAPTVMGKVMRSSIQAIEDTVSLIDPQAYQRAVDAILADVKASEPVEEGGQTVYPGELSLRNIRENRCKGIPVIREIWEAVQKM